MNTSSGDAVVRGSLNRQVWSFKAARETSAARLGRFVLVPSAASQRGQGCPGGCSVPGASL